MSEEEKTIEEQTETIIDAIEAENDAIIEPETEYDVREAFEINKEDGPREALGAPLIRALGDPEPADMTMIHKHLDNFLAKIAGETPIDENVRTSTEYWLKRLADGLGGSTKKIYYHPIYMADNTLGRIEFAIIDNNPNPYDTKEKIIAKVKELCDTGAFVNTNGCIRTANTDNFESVYMIYKNAGVYQIFSYTATSIGNTRSLDTYALGVTYVYDGVNAIN